MKHSMRRSRQQMSQSECLQILQTQSHGVLALQDIDGWPYALPISYVYDPQENALYFHCALQGAKLQALQQDARVCFCVVAQDTVQPETFTTLYQSVLVWGQMEFIEEKADKNAVLEILADKYCPNTEKESREKEIRDNLERTLILKLPIQQISGKQSRELAEQQSEK